MATHVLGDVRQVCTQCGGSCQGVLVSLLPDETARVEAYAQALGVDRPIVDGRLRRDGGRCAFLGADQLCRIHTAYGMKAKPHVCQQYPMVALKVADGVRVGIDPGCYTHLTTWRTAPEVADVALVPNRVEIPASEQAVENALLDCLEDGRLADGLALLTGERPADDGGPGPLYAGRWIARAQQAGLEALFERADTAPAMRDALAPMLATVASLDPEHPPGWSLPPEVEAYAVDAVRRMLFLRVAATVIPMVPAVALLTLSGAVAMAWTTTDPQTYGRGLAAWCRAIRIPMVWRAITPDGETLQRLARGATAG